MEKYIHPLNCHINIHSVGYDMVLEQSGGHPKVDLIRPPTRLINGPLEPVYRHIHSVEYDMVLE
eukprot:scaffold9736_cov144-Skeletonema_marinoi.AAC.11